MSCKRRKQKASAQELKGTVRICLHYNVGWKGFLLQRGHFFGETENGTFFASGLDKSKSGKTKVYVCNTSTGNYVWHVEYLPDENELVKAILEAVPNRKALGIEKVEFLPLEKQSTGYNPRLTTGTVYPYKPMHIPAAGRQTKPTYLVSENKKVPVQAYC